MTARDSNVANFYSSTLTAQYGPTDLTATVATTTGAPASPAYIVIEPGSATQREVIYFDGTFTATTFVTSGLANRYLSGSAAGSGLTHPVGSVVWCAVLSQHVGDLHDRVDALGDHGALSGLTDDDHVNYMTNARHDARDHTAALATSSVTDLSDVDTTGAAAGSVLYFNGTNWVRLAVGTASQQLRVNSGATAPEWVTPAATGPTLVAKSADESVASSTTLQNDDHLSASVDASSTYLVEGLLNWAVASGALSDCNSRVGWTFPAAATFRGRMGDDAVGNKDQHWSDGTGLTLNLNNVNYSVTVTGTLITGGTSGTFQMQWAQGNSHATTLILKAGSWLRLTKV